MTRSERFAKDKQGISITADQRRNQERTYRIKPLSKKMYAEYLRLALTKEKQKGL